MTARTSRALITAWNSYGRPEARTDKARVSKKMSSSSAAAMSLSMWRGLRCRLGAKNVELVSLEQHDEMPAYKEEIEATLAEGITIRNGWGPNRIIGNGSVTGIELKQCIRVFDENGRFNPEYNEKNLITINADQIIVAIGQMVRPELASAYRTWIWNGAASRPIRYTLETSMKGVFAGGDNASGPASVIEAVAAGKRAAESIERYLKGKDMLSDRFEITVKPVPEDLLPPRKTWKRKSAPRRAVHSCLAKRTGNFDEVEAGIFRG